MKKALERLGVEEACFDDVVCFETMNPHLFVEAKDDDDGASADHAVVVLKPSVDAIFAALRVAGTDPNRTVTT
jgi:putative hydrolase of the HAD superfamily